MQQRLGAKEGCKDWAQMVQRLHAKGINAQHKGKEQRTQRQGTKGTKTGCKRCKGRQGMVERLGAKLCGVEAVCC